MIEDALISRLEAGEDEDRVLELDICERFSLVNSGSRPLPWAHCYTVSLDASCAFIRKMLPGWHWSVSQQITGFRGNVWSHDRQLEFYAHAKTPARALMAAALKTINAEAVVGMTGIEPVTSVV